jgi:putative tricarboxylic transport membrane protein
MDTGKKMKRDELVFILLLVLFFVFMLLNSFGLHQIRRFGEIGSGFWPILVLSMAFLLSMGLLGKSYHQFRKGKGKIPEEGKNPGEVGADRGSRRKKLAFTILFLLIYLVIMPWVGFILSTLIYVFAFVFALEERRKLVLAISPVLVTAIMVAVFVKFLAIPLPKGVGVFADLSRLFY